MNVLWLNTRSFYVCFLQRAMQIQSLYAPLFVSRIGGMIDMGFTQLDKAREARLPKSFGSSTQS